MDQLHRLDIREDQDILENNQLESEPMASQSECSLSSIPPVAHGSLVRELSVARVTNLSHDYSVTTSDGSAAYYVLNSIFRRKSPDVTLYGPGGAKAGPVLAASRFCLWTSPIDICLGDPEARDCQWETLMRQHRFKHSSYNFSISMAFESEDASPRMLERRSFTWKRSHGKEVAGGAKWTMRNLKLIDHKTEEVVAVFLAVGPSSWKKRGKFQLRRDWGPQWEMAVLITGLALLEKKARRDRARRKF